jgi:Uma2 family endonuclease
MNETATLPIDPDAPPAGIGEFYEVVNGQFVEPPTMGVHENFLASLLLVVIGNYAIERKLGRVISETLFWISHEKRLQRRPDLAFVSTERWPLNRRVPYAAAWDVIPDLAVEVVSASNTFDDVVEKVEDYFQAGVRRVWVISPARGKLYDYVSDTLVKILTAADTLDGGDVLPGFQLKLGDLFNEPAGTAE